MKKIRLNLAICGGICCSLFTSCIGNDYEVNEDTYGYVSSTSSGTIFINTSAGYSITWNGISDELSSGDCVKVSYKMDYSTLNDAYKVKDVNYTQLTKCELTSDVPINVNDTISALNISAYNSYLWYGNNWFVSMTTIRYPGLTASPKFYYSLDNINHFDSSGKDSIIIDARVEFAGKKNSTTTNVMDICIQEYAVDLSPIRSIMNAVDSIPIYFRYYTSKKGNPSCTTAYYMMKSSYY